ncbi:helix-turn-helix domain-containing protein [Tepidimicrobium xylanilyticum]|uniref:Homeodomain-like domain-containing protein n=1 Tax=Tepidimicrobium xylanilyticum TaxID=1123352 RepID=A0A1H3E9W8_9FIRM|nr:helix-turn-helix domain-containing protein [Tepidimicrobium xylanilyticum]SDX75543.1 hypothetical protein SAMN05660923_02876 [Tepidimicrobium xylanilyticum]
MKVESSLDLRYNIAAMYIAILREDIVTPEQAFAVVEDESIIRVYDNKDVADMVELKNQGLSYREIGQIYGISGDAVYRRIRRHKKRDLPDGSLERSTI